MVLELHIWGPGYGLPSFDASCLATIAVFRECLPAEKWTLISSDPSVSPLDELPAVKDGNFWVAGYRNIVEYLKTASCGKWDVDSGLNSQQICDCTATLSFIESRGLPLLDLLLFVSSENYNGATRPALGTILLWPKSWVIPGRLRDRAKKRSEYLGLSGLDVDTIEDKQDKDDGLAAHIPISLRKPKQTVSSLLGRDVRRNKFRLDAVNADFLDVLNSMLGEQEWLFGDSPSSADSFALSVLTIMFNSTGIPHNWTKTTIQKNYPVLAKWVQSAPLHWFSTKSLPLGSSRARGWGEVLNSVVVTATKATPVLGSLFTAEEVETGTQDTLKRRRQRKQAKLVRMREFHLLYSQVLISSLTLTGLVGVLVWKGIISLPRRAAVSHGRDFGPAGNMLGLR
jgi:sorting and assembly machinery component 37